MIFDSLKHIENYKGLGDVYTALKFLAETDFMNMEIGKYDYNDKIYYSVQEFETSPKTISESHKKYIDIQLIVSGSEVIGIAPIECEKELVDSNPENDIWKYICETQPVCLTDNQFVVLYPNDIHMPCSTMGESVKCRKVVVKIEVN